MPTGRLGAADLAATTLTTLYTCPTSTFSIVNVTICNRNSIPVTIRLALAAGASPGNAEYIEYDSTIPANAVLERTGLVMSAGLLLVVRASGTGVNAMAYGIETSTT